MIQGRVFQAFLVLLRASLWNKPIDTCINLALSDNEWKELYRMSINQTVEGILYDGIQVLDKKYLPPRYLLLPWLVRVEKIEQRNHWLNRMLVDNFLFFKQRQIEPWLLKGQGLAVCYDNPMRRISGDIDWYFTSETVYNAANRRVEEQGLHLIKTAGFSACYMWSGCEVDHHNHLFDIHNPFVVRYLKQFIDFENERKLQLNLLGQHIPVPSPNLQVLQVSSHILKHMLSFGIGFRQLCDLARLYYTYSIQIDGLLLASIFKKLKLWKWINALHKLLVTHLGLPEHYLPFTIHCTASVDWMLEEIWLAGNFGFHDSRYNKNTGTVGEREQPARRLLHNFMKYLPLAPIEALSFPFVHFYSKIIK